MRHNIKRQGNSYLTVCSGHTFSSLLSFQCLFSGVYIVDIYMTLYSGDVKEGVNNQLTFDVLLFSDDRYGSVSGTDLWDFTAYGNSAADGSGPRVFDQALVLGAQADKALPAGVVTDFTSLAVSWNFSLAETCNDVEYICIDISKNAAANPDFLIEPLSVVAGCFSLDCRGQI